MKNPVILCCTALVLLTACGSKEQANTKMARGCEAAVKVMLNKADFTRQIDSVKSKSFGMADGYRLVTIHTITRNKDTGEEADESFDCKFEETQLFNYLKWSASLVQLKIDDVTYGSDAGEIYGSVEDQIALTNAVEEAMK